MKDKIIRIERGATKSGGMMFKCQTAEGNTVNFFDKQYSMFLDYHLELKDLKPGEVVRWKQFPIEVAMYKIGNYWSIGDVSKRPIFAIPDVSVFDVKPYRELARNWAFSAANHSTVVYLDTETTGLTEDAEIISISIVDAHTSEVLLSTLIRPSSLDKITDEITELTGITRLQADTAPRFEQIQGAILVHTLAKNVMAYNVSFDRKMIERECIRHKLPIPAPLAWIDAMEYVAMAYSDYNPDTEQFIHIKLTEAVAKAGLQVSDAHSALGDCLMMRNLLIKMALPETETPEVRDAMNAPVGFGD